ncbi:MAG: hypothetical protein JWO52_5157 [Gammaproteobacteria bacterium]|jgi:hypothetical protein|nr:hypothetical protein [Gammaproteobacteria bacterium]
MGVNWSAGLLRWQPHSDKEGKPYPLHHLHPLRQPFTLAATGKYPERTLDLYFGFSLHTFTHRIMANDDPSDNYSDNRETRAFDYERYHWSFKLPRMARELGSRPCYFARSTADLLNYVTIDKIESPALWAGLRQSGSAYPAPGGTSYEAGESAVPAFALLRKRLRSLC